MEANTNQLLRIYDIATTSYNYTDFIKRLYMAKFDIKVEENENESVKSNAGVVDDTENKNNEDTQVLNENSSESTQGGAAAGVINQTTEEGEEISQENIPPEETDNFEELKDADADVDKDNANKDSSEGKDNDSVFGFSVD